MRFANLNRMLVFCVERDGLRGEEGSGNGGWVWRAGYVVYGNEQMRSTGKGIPEENSELFGGFGCHCIRFCLIDMRLKLQDDTEILTNEIS